MNIQFTTQGSNKENLIENAYSVADQFWGYKAKILNPDWEEYDRLISKLKPNESVEGPEPPKYIDNTESRPYKLRPNGCIYQVIDNGRFQNALWAGEFVAVGPGPEEEDSDGD